MNRRSRSTLFLMEQLIVVAIFAVCAAACVKILTASYFMAVETRNTNNAIRAAESGAESYKAVSGDINKTAEILGGTAVSAGGGAVVVYYNEDWAVCGEAGAAYVLRLATADSASGPASLIQAELTVTNITGETILEFPVATMGGDVR